MSGIEAVREWNARRVISATLAALAVVVGFFLMYRFRWALFSLFVAIVVGTAVRPAVDWLERRGAKRWTAAVVVYLALLGVVIATVALLVPMIVEQMTTVAAKLPGYYQSLRGWMVESSSRTLRRIGSELPRAPSFRLGGPVTAGSLVPETTAWVYAIGHTAFTIVSIMLLGFYWTLEGQRAIKVLLLAAPVARRDRIRELVLAAEGKVGAYVRGQVIICVSVGLMQLVAYLIMGLPYALVLGLIAAILEAVPIIGPTLGAIPAALIALAIAPELIVWVALSTLIVQLTENYVLIPRVMDRSVGVNAVVTLLAIAGFGAMLGLAGALLAIPMAAILQLLFSKLVLEGRAPPEEAQSPGGRGAVGALRYEAKRLALDAHALLRREVAAQRETGDIDVTDEVVDAVEAIATDVDLLLGALEPEPAPVPALPLVGRPT